MGRVVVLNDVSIARGGATSLALASIRGLRARGVAVTLITGDDGDNPELDDIGVGIVPMGQALLLDAGMREAFFRGLYNRRTIAVVGDWISRNDTPDTVYHVHTWAKILSPSLFQALRPVAGRLIVSAHDFFLVCPNGGYVFYGTGSPCQLRPMSFACLRASCDRRSYGHKLWRVARQAVRQQVFDMRRSSPLVLAVHDGMRPGLERAGIPHTSIRVLRNPVRPFTSHRITAERNREIVFIGRLNTEKGADLAAKAARRAGARLRIIGGGPMSGSLQRNYPEVIFDGPRTQAEIGGLVASARVLVMPSRYPEPFGLVAGEALWSGLPVILGDTALMAGEITARGAGVACDVRNEVVLAAAMRQLLDRDADTQRMSINAFESTRDLATTPSEWMEALVGVYEELSPADHTDSLG
jgi:glycosyltransferase involved in cell wall biosynthesis